ncbi:MAG: AGE family epimerase/isomerase [Oscillospiraceae bacterium]|jgi:mannobiose 2-epimerase|nr:AGE family epimerase/isomerase [Oscillospiraceae bacterium]
MNIKEIKAHLTDCIIPFWKNLRDEESGGFYGEVDYALNINKQADKGGILNSRILWFFSNAYLTLGDESCLEYAKHACEFLKEAFYDKKYGGIFWSVDYKGNVKDDRKYTYNFAFAVYALASYYDASKDKNVLKLANALAHDIEEKCSDESGYLEAFSRDFMPIENEQLSENGVIAHRTMNTLLHVFEAYTELYRADKCRFFKGALERMLDLFAEKIYNPEKKRLDVFFDLDYKPLIDLTSYGHDIEASWLIDRGTDVLDVPRVPFTRIIADRIHEIALDKDGSVFNEDVERNVDTKKVWWVQAEAVLGFLNAGYPETAGKTLNYIKKHMIDSRPGSEWFNELRKDNTPIKEKAIADLWKCPYHNGRMCFEIIKKGMI